MREFLPLDILGPQPGAIRRAFCELTGGHDLEEESAFRSSIVFAYRIRCARCGVVTRWRSTKHERAAHV